MDECELDEENPITEDTDEDDKCLSAPSPLAIIIVITKLIVKIIKTILAVILIVLQ